MADYIKTNILFEAYVHIDAHFEEESEATESVRRHINDYISNRATHFLYQGINTEIKFKEGSLKAYATVRGSLKASLGAYSNFQSAINGLFWFSKRLSDATVMEVAFQTGSFLGAIERTEARPGIVGQTKRIVDLILSINNADDDRVGGTILRRMRTAERDIVNLLDAISDDDDIELVKSEFKTILDLTPKAWRNAKVSEESKNKYLEQRKMLFISIE